MTRILSDTIRSVIKKNTPALVILAGLSLLSTALQTLSPWPYKLLIDNILGNELLPTDTLVGRLLDPSHGIIRAGSVVVAAYFTVSLLSDLVSYSLSMFQTKTLQKINYQFASAVFSNISLFDYGYYTQRDPGGYIYKLNYDAGVISDLIEDTFLPIFSSAVYFTASIVILSQIDMGMTLVSLGALPLLSISLLVLNKKISASSKKIEVRNSLLYTYIDTALQQLKVIQIYRQEENARSAFGMHWKRSQESELEVDRYTFLLTLANGLILTICYTAIITLGINLVLAGIITTGLFMLFIFYLDTLTAPVITIIESLASYRQNRERIGNLSDIFDPAHHTRDTGHITHVDDHTIAYENVTVQGEDGHILLENVSASFPSKGLVIIAGANGAGKSTLLNCIPRLHSPSSGRVSLGSHSLEEYKLNTLRDQIALVPQDLIVTDQTIRDVISFGIPGTADMDLIEKAARAAHAHDFIISKEEKYASRVGQNGNLLSGGQKQRLLLARAYLKNAPILLLDEVFAGQDAKMRRLLMGSIRRYAAKHAVFMVTHTYDILEDSDRVVILEKGRIAADGLYSALKNNRIFSKDTRKEVDRNG